MYKIPSAIAGITTIHFHRLYASLTTADRDNHATFNRELDRQQRSLSTESALDILKIPVKVSIIISDALTRDRSASSRGIRSTRSNRKNSTIPPDQTWKVPRDYRISPERCIRSFRTISSSPFSKTQYLDRVIEPTYRV